MNEPATGGFVPEQPAFLIAKLESLMDGGTVAERLIAMGQAAIPWLERFLLEAPARTIALPRAF